jgi:hypothetical protein
MRVSLYRAADGAWYVGRRDWNAALSRFNGIQPVTGPFLSAAAGGLAFQYLDSAGGVLATPLANRGAVAAVRIDLRSETRLAPRAFGTGTGRGGHHDSASVVVLLRNRR